MGRDHPPVLGLRWNAAGPSRRQAAKRPSSLSLSKPVIAVIGQNGADFNAVAAAKDWPGCDIDEIHP
jgi:hypothetical protein